MQITSQDIRSYPQRPLETAYLDIDEAAAGVAVEHFQKTTKQRKRARSIAEANFSDEQSGQIYRFDANQASLDRKGGLNYRKDEEETLYQYY